MEHSGYSSAREWVLSSEYGQEKQVLREVADMALMLESSPSHRIDDMLTAVSEAFLNAAEHGNLLAPSLPIRIIMLISDTEIVFRIYDRGSGMTLDQVLPTLPSIQLNKENPRGWGLYLISSLADRITTGWEEGSFYMEIGFSRSGTSEGGH